MQRSRTALLLSFGLALALLDGFSLAADSPKLRVATFRYDVTPPISGHPLIWLDQIESAAKLVWRLVPLVLPARTDGDRSAEASRAVAADAKANPQARALAACRVAYAQRDDRTLPLSSLQIGDAWLVNLPGECMAEYQLAQAQRPRQFVAVAAYGDLGPGYICTQAAFSEGGYEPTASRIAPESEGAMKTAIRKLLGGVE